MIITNKLLGSKDYSYPDDHVFRNDQLSCARLGNFRFIIPNRSLKSMKNEGLIINTRPVNRKTPTSYAYLKEYNNDSYLAYNRYKQWIYHDHTIHRHRPLIRNLKAYRLLSEHLI